MGRITLQQAADWCGGKINPKYANTVFVGASNDSRSIQPGQLFVAIKGERDGHDFIPKAIQNSAAAILCSRCNEDIPAIIVDDPLKALGDIARQERLRIGMKVVGVTGSVGKSTTKELIACVLSGERRVAKTPANHNNNIGMPMALLAMPEDTEIAVVEMGMNHFREIAYLSSISQPDLAVIINIGTMHIEHLGTQEGILQAKLEILEGMKEGSRIFLNGDDNLLWNVSGKLRVPVTYFGARNCECSVLATNVTETQGALSFDVTAGNKQFSVSLQLEGTHYVPDALAAIAVGLSLGVTPEQIADRLSTFQNLAGRQEIFEAKGYTIIKDCYNAGPESMAAALAVLGKKEGRHVAVLGDMLELGVCTQAEHYRVGRIAAEKAQIVLAYGPNSRRIISGALTGGMPDTKAMAFEDRDQLVATLKRMAKPGDVILFKGSHGMHMELALEKFLSDET